MTTVLDSSVVLAILRGEIGEAEAAEIVRDACISSVNVAEVITKCVEQDFPEDAAMELIEGAGIRVIPFEADHAVLAGRLRKRAPKGVLSLGDRACLATAIMLDAVAVTADKVWATLDIGCKVELIR